MQFKNQKVWLAVDDSDAPLIKNGKWLIKYRLDQDYQYWVRPENVSALESASAATAKKNRPRKPVAQKQLFENQGAAGLRIYTDGAASGNPGPAGIGVVWHQDEDTRELSQYIGETTNNVAELEAIRTALAAVGNKAQAVTVHTDSGYAYGLLTQGWKAKKNRELVGAIKELMEGFENLTFVKVRGHAGDRWNERADELARKAVKSKNIK